MEKLNLNFSGGDNVVKSICWIMSYLSWLLLVASGWASIKWLDEKPSSEEDASIIVLYMLHFDINCYYRWLLCIFLQNNL